MRKLWLTLGAILALALTHVPAAQAAPSAACPDAGSYIVDTALDAADLAEGYKNPVCDLVIKTSIPLIIGEVYNLEAKSVTIQGPDILDAAKRVEIINSNPSGDVIIKAVNGDVNITEGVVKGRDRVHIDCTNPNNCKITILFSEVMAPLSVLDPDGDVRVNARGDVRIENSTYFGGNFLYITSNTGSIVWFCPGGGECKDPITSGQAAVLCPNTPQFPCTVTFNNASELKNVCQQGTLCGGGDKEIRITAFIDIDIQGSTITAFDHVTLTAKTGKILAGKKGANITTLTGESWVFNALTGMDFTDAVVKTTKIIDMSVGSGCSAPTVCIDARRSTMQAQEITMIANNKAGIINVCDAKLDDVSNNPKLNGDTTEPFDPNVVDTALECAPGTKVNLDPLP
jgi:hypothetical protein